jgi:hypothetical protein
MSAEPEIKHHRLPIAKKVESYKRYYLWGRISVEPENESSYIIKPV